MIRRIFVLSLAVLFCACKADAPTPPVAPPSDARAFVVEFYAWYAPSPDTLRTEDNVLAQRRASLSPDLAALLDADMACSSAKHEVCNLDRDPFVNSQDSCERYEVGGMIQHHDTVGVSVFSVCGGSRDSVPTVIAMVVRRDSMWQFADFVYPDASLHSMLSRKPE